MWQDLRDALRSFRKTPLFAAGVAGTIGLGLGFLCSAFTVINGYLLKPFDVRDPHALYLLTFATGRVVPALLVSTWPEGLPPLQALLAPMEPDLRVVSFLILSAVGAAVFFGLSPALQTTRTSLTRASRGEFGMGIRVSRLRNTLVVMQIAAGALFLVTASGLLAELGRLSRADTGLDIGPVVDLRAGLEYRGALIDRLASDSRVERIAGTRRPPLYGLLRTVPVTPAGTTEQVTAGYMIVSAKYFELFRIPLVRGRAFTDREADAEADVAVVSEATARRFWPHADAVGQTLIVSDGQRVSSGVRGPAHTRVSVIGIARDVTSGAVMDGRGAPTPWSPSSSCSGRGSSGSASRWARRQPVSCAASSRSRSGLGSPA